MSSSFVEAHVADICTMSCSDGSSVSEKSSRRPKKHLLMRSVMPMPPHTSSCSRDAPGKKGTFDSRDSSVRLTTDDAPWRSGVTIDRSAFWKAYPDRK